MKRIQLLIMICFCLSPVFARNNEGDILKAATAVNITGFEGEKLSLSLNNRVLAQDVDILVFPFTNRTETSCWQGEFWGKWITSAILAYQYRPSSLLRGKIDKAVSDLIATQSKDGYIGNYAPGHRLEAWDIWGQKYCMLGLIAYYDISNNKKALDAAERLGNYLVDGIRSRDISIVKLGNHRGMAASSVLEPFCLLYVRTGQFKFLEFAEDIVKQWETPDGPQLISKAAVNVSERFPKPSADNWYGWDQGQKAYEMMSCYEGLLELYRITGRPEYRKAAEQAWENIRTTEINLAGSGAAKECWFGGAARQALPVHHYQETCVTATWIKLSYQLLRLTGESKYADAIEQSLYNALPGSVLPDGSDWAKYSPLSGKRMMGNQQCGMGLNCCVASGPRALFLLPQAAVMQFDDGAQVNLFLPGEYRFKSPSNQEIRLIQTTRYPAEGRVNMVVDIPKTEQMVIRIRKPAWNSKTRLYINGGEIQSEPTNGYYEISRKWNPGDAIRLDMEMPGILHVLGGEPGYFAITRGPVLLSRDARLGGLNPDAVITPLLDSDGHVNLVSVESTDSLIRMQFSAVFMPESYTEEGPKPVNLLLCDYASAGNTYDEKSWFRTWFQQLLDPSVQQASYQK